MKSDMLKEILQNLRILYVEDDENIREVLSRVLKRKTKELSVAVNGEDGYEKYKSFQPDLIITDIKMPVLSGLEMSKKIREEDKNTPIIITSAHGESETLIEAISVGVSGYILKPIDKDKLFSTIALYGEKKILQKKIEEQKEQLIIQDKNQAILDMVSNIAHQWRQPLSVISTSASAILLKKELGFLDDEFLINSMNSIDKNSQYLSHTIDSFRDFVEGDKEDLYFNISDVINKALDFHSFDITNNHITIIKEFDESLNIKSKKIAFMQSIVNILSNSIEAISSLTSSEKIIKLVLKKEQNNIMLTIEDNGDGIDEKIINKIFEPYFTTKHQSQGVGMGLHMTYNTIKSMNGNIKIENKKTSGVIVTIVLNEE